MLASFSSMQLESQIIPKGNPLTIPTNQETL